MKGLLHVELKSIQRADKINPLPGWTTREFTTIPSRNLVEQTGLGISDVSNKALDRCRSQRDMMKMHSFHFTKMICRNFCILAAAFNALQFAKGAVKAEGRLIRQYHQITGELNEHHIDSFVMTLESDGQWLLDYVEDGKGESRAQVGYDGQDIFRVIKRSPDSDISDAWVTAGAYPLDSPARGEKIIWVAFGSAHWLDTAPDGEMPAPWIESRLNPQSYVFRSTEKRLQGPPRLPQTLSFVRDSSLDKDEQSSIFRAEINYPRAESFRKQLKTDFEDRTYWENGFLTAEYEVISSTNVAGLEIPLSFEWRLFHPAWHRAKGSTNFANLFIGLITNVSVIDTFSPRPHWTGTLVVVDRRFRVRDAKHRIDEISYVLQPKDGWKDKADPVLQRLWAVEMREAGLLLNSTEQKIRSVVILVVLCGLIAAAIWVIRRQHKTKNTT